MSSDRGERGPLRVVIVGAGPSGSALAILLNRQGADVTLFDDPRRPSLLVGESLVPAVVPILRRLGIEEQIASFSRVKPGATFTWSSGDEVRVAFDRFAPDVFPYAYNIPRPRFDEAVLGRAVAGGVRHVPVRAQLQRAGGDGAHAELELAPATLAAAPALEGRQPHLIVDATGRARYVAHVLEIPARMGPRKDVAHFAHFDGFRWDDLPGQVVVTRGQAGGWTWRIPLQDELSIGIVLDQHDAAKLGRTPEERLERAIATDPALAPTTAGARRVTPVATYANYQLISERGHGRGWVMIGDAFGFIDPIFSSGLLIALDGATRLAHAILAGSPRELRRFERHVFDHLTSWRRVVGYFYDGRLFTLLKVGDEARKTWFGRLIDPHLSTHFPRVFTGENTTNRYSLGLLGFMCRHSLGGRDPSQLQVN